MKYLLDIFLLPIFLFSSNDEIYLLSYQEKDVKRYCHIGIENSENGMTISESYFDYRYFEGKNHAYKEILQVLSD